MVEESNSVYREYNPFDQERGINTDTPGTSSVEYSRPMGSSPDDPSWPLLVPFSPGKMGVRV